MLPFSSLLRLAPLALLTLLTACTQLNPNSTPNAQNLNPPDRPCPLPTIKINLNENVFLELVRIPPGQFLMGSPPNEPGRRENEGPQHRVHFDKPFYMSRYEITQAQWRAVTGKNPGFRANEDLLFPVERVHWADCFRFCKKLSDHIGKTARLPTEAEWEYACRANSTTAFHFGDNPADLKNYGLYSANSGGKIKRVGLLKPNPWGLFDMYGNVWEWCFDPWQPDYVDAPTDGTAFDSPRAKRNLRVLRGASWFNPANFCRSAFRYRRTGALRSAYIGFRVVVETD